VIVATNVSVALQNNFIPTNNCGLADERTLLTNARKGRATAFDELCQRHLKKIMQTTLRITRNREDAEDAMQDALLRAYLHICEFDGRSSFATWLTRIAINSALMILRKKRSIHEVPVDSPGDVHPKEPCWEATRRNSNPESLYAQQEEECMLHGAIGELRPSIRKVLELQQLQERSMKETAKMMGISQGAAKARLFHAKIALRKSVRKRVNGQRPFGTLQRNTRQISGSSGLVM
jgi:RNA polymerase sigma factor (sigma-70 family)